MAINKSRVQKVRRSVAIATVRQRVTIAKATTRLAPATVGLETQVWQSTIKIATVRKYSEFRNSEGVAMILFKQKSVNIAAVRQDSQF